MAELVRAAVQTGPRRIEIREFPRPATGPDDGLLRIEACGICGSNVEQYRGHLGRNAFPLTLGHEPLGIVEDVGERAAARWGVQAGDRVALEILIPCRSCDLCLAGRYMSCPAGQLRVQPGQPRAEPVRRLRRLRLPAPERDRAQGVRRHPGRGGRDVQPAGAGVRWAAHLGGIQLGDTVLILGPGQRGLCAVIAARAVGAGTIIVTGLGQDRGKLELAREFGADHTIDVEAEDTVARVGEITGGRLADVVLELTPMAADPVRDALRAVRHGGRVVLAGLKGGRPVELNTDMIINKAITVTGAYGVDSRAYGEAIRIIEAGQVPLHRLHTHSFELADLARAIETLGGEVPGEDAVHVAIRPQAPA
jgi:threonine dehydrogenase-like Zn-dependent dehydrogenase